MLRSLALLCILGCAGDEDPFEPDAGPTKWHCCCNNQRNQHVDLCATEDEVNEFADTHYCICGRRIGECE